MIVLTGGAGFIGSVILERLNREGQNEILVVDRLESSDKWKNLLGKHFIRIILPEVFAKQLEEKKYGEAITAIIHMGAISSTTEKNVDLLLSQNFDFSCLLADYCRERAIRFIYASSAATYGNGEAGYQDGTQSLNQLRPSNPYGFSKHLFDQWAQKTKLLDSAVGLKFFNVFGPNEYHKGKQASVALHAFRQLRDKQVINLFRSENPKYLNGQQMRDFIYVRDVADVVYWFLLEGKSKSGLFNLGSGKARSWQDLAGAVAKSSGVDCKINYIDMPEELKRHYQYFTEAPVNSLRAAGYKTAFTDLEAAVEEYVKEFLIKEESYL